MAHTFHTRRAHRACPMTAPQLLRQSATGGLIAGVSTAVYQGVMAVLLQEPFLAPSRLVAAMLLGPEALNRWYSPGTVTVVALGIHTLLSLVFGVLFGILLTRRPPLRASRIALTAAATIFGATLWFLNFYLIAPVFDWLWFILRTHPLWQGLIGHALFFGAVLGLFLAYRCPRELADSA
jgi:uncharacterized protein YneF (UPF0154 family)